MVGLLDGFLFLKHDFEGADVAALGLNCDKGTFFIVSSASAAYF